MQKPNRVTRLGRLAPFVSIGVCLLLSGCMARQSQDQYEGQFKVVGNTFSEEFYGVGLPKENDICEDVNAAITEMIEDGTWEELLAEHTPEGFTPDDSLNPPEVDGCA